MKRSTVTPAKIQRHSPSNTGTIIGENLTVQHSTDPSDDQVGVESLQVEEVKVHSNQRTIDLAVPGLRPVDQLHLTLQIESAEGEDFAEEIYWTIHRILDQ